MSTFYSKYKKFKRARSASKRYRKYSRTSYGRRYRSAPRASRGYYGSVSRIRRQIQGVMERKYHDSGVATYNADVGGNWLLLNQVAQGAGVNERIGSKYTVTSVQIEGYFAPQLPCLSSKVRLLVVYDAQANGTLATLTDVLTSSNALAFMNLQNRDRFKVILDETFSLGAVDNTATQSYACSPAIANVSRYVRTNLEVVNGGPTSGIGDIKTGSIVALVVGTAPAGQGYTFYGNSRIRFIDA